MNKTAITLLVSILVVTSLPLFAAHEKWMIPVTADIRRAITVTPSLPYDFGRLFAQELVYKSWLIGMSNPAATEYIQDKFTLDLEICSDEDPTYGPPSLGPFMYIKENTGAGSEPTPSDPGTVYQCDNGPLTFSLGYVPPGDPLTLKRYWVSVLVPNILKYNSQDPQLCLDPVSDQSCDEQVGNGIGIYHGKIDVTLVNVDRSPLP